MGTYICTSIPTVKDICFALYFNAIRHAFPHNIRSLPPIIGYSPASLLLCALWQKYGAFIAFSLGGAMAVAAALLFLIFLPAGNEGK